MEDLTSALGAGEGIIVDTTFSDMPENVEDGASVTIEVDDLPRLQESSTSFSCSIYRVPQCLRHYNEKLYDPQVISIGPFHYEKRKNQLQAMEEHKRRYLQDIISRNGEGILERCLAVLEKLEEKARTYYSEVIPLDSRSFVEMMLLDACFIIEYFRKIDTKEFDDDFIFQTDWLVKAILCDLMMLENQIPFFIIRHLFDPIADCCQHSLLETVTFLFKGPSVEEEMLEHSVIEIQHLLHFLHTILLDFPGKKCSKSVNFQKISCASKLKEAGIKFKNGDADDDDFNLLDIKFQKGVISIPSIEFWDEFNRSYLNLIAFEQCYCPCKKYLTAFIAFMNCLITTGKDVEILCHDGIIQNWVGSGGDVVSLYNNIVRELTVREEDFYPSGICKEVNQYCEGTWPKMRATLVHDYFRNRWAIISFFAALFLLLLTITQTFFTSFPKFAYGN